MNWKFEKEIIKRKTEKSKPYPGPKFPLAHLYPSPLGPLPCARLLTYQWVPRVISFPLSPKQLCVWCSATAWIAPSRTTAWARFSSHRSHVFGSGDRHVGPSDHLPRRPTVTGARWKRTAAVTAMAAELDRLLAWIERIPLTVPTASRNPLIAEYKEDRTPPSCSHHCRRG
jgi:hypothetical protein